jgi:hypothetical protein
MSTISNSRRLRREIEPVLPILTSETSAVVSHPQFRELYAEFLITVHQMVRATVPLMRTALRRCLELKETDPVAAAMAPYFEQHIKEELHHDDWILEDLEVIGMPREAVLRRMPSSAIASYIGGHYYWIYHHHPVAKLGQIAVVEGYPPSVDSIDMMVERTGYPRAAFRTLEKHCHLDANHRDDFDEAIDRMPLEEVHFAILQVSIMHTVRTAGRAYREILKRTRPATVLPERRPELSATRTGENGSYRVEDVLRDAVYQIGEREHFLLMQCDGLQSAEEVCRAYGDRFGQSLSSSELDEFLDLARAQHFFAEEREPR